ncbi:MAG TPA: MotA/TolQ/ExbB proton channel family protein [Gammaproteobacteria bacterium]|nr:MotA/TolQ/ExbB proton channel family protein [Gammaproteobacteria bacterium]
MLELIKAGGWVMWPIMLASVIAMAIVVERFWSLQTKRIAPPNLVAQVWQWLRNGQLDEVRMQALRAGSPLGRILAAGLVNRHHDRTIIRECVEEAGRVVVFELERYLNTLGTIAAVSPLLGLLGTVFGMIQMFGALKTGGAGDPAELAGGIGQALITTAAGLLVAIPALYFYRYFRGRVDALVITMEQEAVKLIEVLQGEREQDDELAGQRAAKGRTRG